MMNLGKRTQTCGPETKAALEEQTMRRIRDILILMLEGCCNSYFKLRFVK